LHFELPLFNRGEQKIEQPFLEAVKETLEERYTENMESIYQITIKLVIETLIEGYEEGKTNAQPNESKAVEQLEPSATSQVTSG
jgi:hypothetical protein